MNKKLLYANKMKFNINVDLVLYATFNNNNNKNNEKGLLCCASSYRRGNSSAGDEFLRKYYMHQNNNFNAWMEKFYPMCSWFDFKFCNFRISEDFDKCLECRNFFFKTVIKNNF